MYQMPSLSPGLDSLAGWWFFSCNGSILTIEQGARIPFGQFQELPIAASWLTQAEYFAEYKGEPCYRLDIDACLDLGLGEWMDLRGLMTLTEPDLFMLAGRAVQHALFLKTHQFCGQCGSKLARVRWELAMQCDSCDFRAYPRLSPSIIVAVSRNDELLLACHRRHKKNNIKIYTVLAGFAEPGETLEQCVAREVYEEAGIRVKNIRYFGSQPWPFPHSMMVAFMADYKSGEIRVERRELADARWFSVHDLPLLPSHGTIAREMIQDFFSKT